MKLFLLGLCLFICVLTQETLPMEKLKLPPGFKIEILARVPNARQMAISPKGYIFVGSRESGTVHVLVPLNDKWEMFEIAKGLLMPVGLAIHRGSLYVTAVSRVLRYDNIEDNIRNPPTPVVVATFPSDTHHGWKYLKIHNDKMFIAVGAPCNICNVTSPYGDLMSMNLDGSDVKIIAKGVRNTVGYDWDPDTKDLWFTDNGRDMMGDDLPPDELNHVKTEGLHYGYPFCHGKAIPDPQFNPTKDCTKYVNATYELGPHVASLGMTFYQGNRFPMKYRHNIFIAEHGSWNRRTPIGYRISFVDKHDPKSYQVFIDGWLQLPPNAVEFDSRFSWGRPADVINFRNDLLISDDKAGAIYRVHYE